MTRSEAVLLLAVVGFVALVAFGAVGVEVHHLFAAVDHALGTVTGG